MPELPEVETIRRDLEKSILRKTIRKVEVLDPFVLRTPHKKFIKTIEKHSISAISRRGKALIIECSPSVIPERFPLLTGTSVGRNRGSRIQDSRFRGNDKIYLVVQLMMTGQLVVDSKVHKHTRVIFRFSDKRVLLYNDQRRFGQLRAVKDLAEVQHLNILGPEPFDQKFNPAYIFEYTCQSKRPIKTLLLDNTFVAGIGNIYACEILFRCGIAPDRFSGRLSPREVKSIHQNIVVVLKEAIKHRGSSIRNYRDAFGKEGEFKKLIQVYAREYKECFRCTKPIKRIVQAGRSTFYCSKCQK